MQGAHRGIGTFALLAACTTQPATEPEPCTWNAHRIVSTSATSDAVDLLFVIDNSESMLAEQHSVAEIMLPWVELLMAPPDADGNGYPDRPEVGDLHVGIVSADLGTGGFAAEGCADPIDGDGGILDAEPRQEAPECQGDYPRYLIFREGDDPEEVARDIACLEVLGTDGCPFQQPLNAAVRALLDERGAANGDFLRDDSLLAVVFVTDGDDCSARGDGGTALFDGSRFSSPANVRCAIEGAPYLADPAHFAAALADARGWPPPERLVVAVLGGVPGDVTCPKEGSPEWFDCLLADPRMTPKVDDDEQRLAPSCVAPDGDAAAPPRRLVTMLREAAALGATAVAASTCAPDPAAAFETVVEAIQSRVYGDCLSRPLPVRADGGVDCIVEEELLDDGPCPVGRVDLGTTDRGRLCHVCQQGDGTVRTTDMLGNDLRGCADAQASGDFWEYGHWWNCTVTGRIEFRGASMPLPGSTLSLECFERDC